MAGGWLTWLPWLIIAKRKLISSGITGKFTHWALFRLQAIESIHIIFTMANLSKSLILQSWSHSTINNTTSPFFFFFICFFSFPCSFFPPVSFLITIHKQLPPNILLLINNEAPIPPHRGTSRTSIIRLHSETLLLIIAMARRRARFLRRSEWRIARMETERWKEWTGLRLFA